MEFQFAQSKGQKMSRLAHFLDPYQFQIEEMVKLGCTDEHICRVLEDITGKEVKKRVIANKRMWLRKMENKRKQYEPYKGEIKYMIEYGLTIQNIYAAISEESGIDASIETFKNFLKDNDMMPESKKQEASVKDIFGNIANYMEFHEGWVRTSCRLNRAMSNPNRILMRRYLQ